MKFSFITFLALSCCISAGPERGTPIDEFLVAILQLFREQMPTGISEAGIPPLEPFLDLPKFEVHHIE